MSWGSGPGMKLPQGDMAGPPLQSRFQGESGEVGEVGLLEKFFKYLVLPVLEGRETPEGDVLDRPQVGPDSRTVETYMALPPGERRAKVPGVR